MPVWFRDLPPFVQLIGLEVVSHSPEHTETKLGFKPELQNRKGDLHGGVLATILDATLGLAARAGLADEAATATVSLTIQYLSPARTNVRCIARCIKAGGSIRFLEGKVIDANETPLAIAVGTFKLITT